MNLKESRISFLVLFSLSLLLLAFIILFAWGFMYYRNAAETVKAQPVMVIKDSSAIANAIKDSLQKMYAGTWEQLNQQLDAANTNADSLQGNIDIKYQEFSQIRTEIARLLETNKTPTQLDAARIKLVELQLRLEDWRKKYNDVAAENVRLSALLRQLASTPAGRTNVNTTIAAVIPARNRNTEINTPAMRVQGWQLRAEEMDDDKVRLKGSLDVMNNDNNSSVEMFVVILQPDGKLLKQSGWDSGSFETKDGTKIYSCRLKFDCPKGENKSLNFSVPSGNFQKGMYSIQVYHKGVMVARGNKNLS
ncbi:MAG: hypothetical protein EOO03_03500 [Chitinophagaceae bacterium]|nr:MAG: hypothetical protein EOO03_03500 [Chitinophagaceae bacterium]